MIKHEDKELSDAVDKERLCKQHEEQNMERLFAGLSFGIDSIDDTLAEDLKTTVMELGGGVAFIFVSAQLDVFCFCMNIVSKIILRSLCSVDHW